MSLLQEWEEEQDRQAADKKKMARYRARQAAIRKQNKTLKADLAALRERMRWVPVGERSPTAADCDPYGRVLINDPKFPNFHDHGTFDQDRGWTHWNTGGKACPTHWFPLPAAPEVQGLPSSHSKEVSNG